MIKNLVIPKEALVFGRSKLLAHQQDRLDSTVVALQQKAKAAKAALFYFSNEEYRQMHPLYKDLLIKNAFYDLFFFPDEQVSEKLSQLGLEEFILDDFVPLDNILAELNTIAASESFLFLKDWAFQHIQCYVRSKTAAALRPLFIKELNALGKGKYVSLQDLLSQIGKQRNYYGGSPAALRDHIRLLLHQGIEEAKPFYGGERRTRALVRNQLNGRTESTHLRWLTESALPPQDSTAYYAMFYRLFSLIVTHRNWPTKMEHADRTGYAGRSYEWFQGDLVKKTIRGVSSDFGSMNMITVV